MKPVKTLVRLILLTCLFGNYPLLSNSPTSFDVEVKKREQKIRQAAIWNYKGVECYTRKEFFEAIKCFQNALNLHPAEVTIVINLTEAYIKVKKFAEAQQLLVNKMDGLGKSGNIRKLRVILAEVYYLWAEHFEINGNITNAIKHFEMAYTIDKNDRPKKALVDLDKIGELYFSVENNLKALKSFEKALTLSQKFGSQTDQSVELVKIATVLLNLGENQNSLDYFFRAWDKAKKSAEPRQIAAILNGIGIVYSNIGANQKALKYYKDAISFNERANNEYGIAINQNNIADVYHKLGENTKALKHYQIALTFFRNKGHKVTEARALNSIGAIYYELGINDKALRFYHEALTIFKKEKKRIDEAKVLNNIGQVHIDLKRHQTSIKYFDESLEIFQSKSYRTGEAAVSLNLGYAYYELSEIGIAIEYYKKAISLKLELGDRLGEALVLNNLAGVYHSIGEDQKAVGYLQRILPIWREVESPMGESKTISNLMYILDLLKKRKISVFFGKLSVNIFQKLRGKISESKYQSSFLKGKIDTYRKLAYVLISEGRLSEARQVLNIMKEGEYFDFIRRDSSYYDNLSGRIDFSRHERMWLQKYNTVIEKLSKISSEYHLMKFKKRKSNVEKEQMNELGSKLQEAQKTYNNVLDEMKVAFAQYEENKKAVKEDVAALEKKAIALQNTLKYLDETEGGKNTAIHFLVYKSSISAIITIPDSPPILKQWKADEQELNKTVMNYITLIMKSGENVKGIELLKTYSAPEKKHRDEILHELIQYEKKLYNLIFEPVDEVLQKFNVTNLTISLDGVLRYIPLGTLWDGENFLIQRYRMALVTPTSLRNIKDAPIEKKKILGFGASRGGEGFTPLLHVGREIRSIVKDEKKGFFGLIKGKGFINDDFTWVTMLKQLKTGSYPLVHISSHFKFSPGDETKNKLLLGDGNTIKLSEIRREGNLFKNVNLLVLSACETGVGGSGEEIDGFGELAQQSGAKSVIASLWPVADESTKDLMVAFYRNLKEGKVTSKIEALRQAQLELAGLEDLLGKGKNKSEQPVWEKTKYSHPYYWGPFIMIGNWR